MKLVEMLNDESFNTLHYVHDMMLCKEDVEEDMRREFAREYDEYTEHCKVLECHTDDRLPTFDEFQMELEMRREWEAKLQDDLPF